MPSANTRARRTIAPRHPHPRHRATPHPPRRHLAPPTTKYSASSRREKICRATPPNSNSISTPAIHSTMSFRAKHPRFLLPGRRSREISLQMIASIRPLYTPPPLNPRTSAPPSTRTPNLRAAWHDASAYRESSQRPKPPAKPPRSWLTVNHMDALFFSSRPEITPSLARAIANLDPAAFASLANAMHREAPNVAHLLTGGAVSPNSSHTNQLRIPRAARNDNVLGDANANSNAPGATNATPMVYVPAGTFSEALSARPAPLPSPRARATRREQPRNPPPTNPNSPSSTPPQRRRRRRRRRRDRSAGRAIAPGRRRENARTRVVGEIYRELDSSLRSNPQFAAQLRDAFRSRLARRRPPARHRLAPHRTRPSGPPQRSQTRPQRMDLHHRQRRKRTPHPPAHSRTPHRHSRLQRRRERRPQVHVAPRPGLRPPNRRRHP